MNFVTASIDCLCASSNIQIRLTSVDSMREVHRHPLSAGSDGVIESRLILSMNDFLFIV